MSSEISAVPAYTPQVEVHDEKFSDELDHKEEHSANLSDSKATAKAIEAGELDVNELVLSQEVGDVFEDKRVIDLDENGNEKPIDSADDYAIRLISLEDDPSLKIHTFRMWFLGLGLSCFGAVLGQLFYFRPQTISVSSLFLQIFAYIMGKGLEMIMPGSSPTARIKLPDSAIARFLNHGPFNLKEHVAITIMSSTASVSSTAISIFAAQELYYNTNINAGVGIFGLLASQLIGYGMAGIWRSVLVYPTYAVYPMLVPTVQLFDAMHRGQGIFLQKKRVKFFWGVFAAIFVWEWFPEYIAPLLTGVSIFCLADQHSPWVTRVFGGASGNEGLGTFSLCFDWNYIGSGGSSIGSLFTPLYAQMSLYGGCAICMIVFCAVYAGNVWHAQNFPFLSQLLFNENGSEYDQLAILNADFSLNNTKLDEIGLPYYAATYMIYLVSRTLYIGAMVTHFALWHGADIWKIIKSSRTQDCPDPHYQKMKVYKEVPMWWYGAMFLVTFGVAMGTCYGGNSGLPWWGLIVSLIFAFVFLPIVSTLYATVGYAPSIQNLVQMVGGAMIPGKPVANMWFTLYGFNTVVQSYGLLKDLKMAQYTKLPFRTTFTVQTVGCIIGGVLNYVIMKSVIAGNREILLDVQGSNVWSGQQVQSYNSGAIAWGALAKPLYAPGSRYGFVPWMIIAGLGFPIPFYFLHQWQPNFGWNKVFTPILVAELGYLSVGINSSVFTSFAMAIFSQWYLRKYRARWFRKYNFLLSAALDGGTQIMVFIYSFAVGGASGKAIAFPNWAFNPNTADHNLDYCKKL